MLFLLGQRAAKIALDSLQHRALVLAQAQPLGFALWRDRRWFARREHDTMGMPLVCDETMMLSLSIPSGICSSVRCVFRLGQRAAKIALHDGGHSLS